MENIKSSSFNRRQILKGSLAGLGVSALAACTSNASNNISSPHLTMLTDEELYDRRHEIKQRMRFRMNEGRLNWSFQGRIYAQQGALIIPMFDLVHCVFGLLQPRQSGGFNMLSYELGFRTDLKTGERLTQYTNPFNQDVINVPFAPVGPIELGYTSEIHLQLPDNIGGSKIEFKEEPDIFYQADNMIYMDQNSQTRVLTPNKPDRIINEIATMYGKTELLTNKSVDFAPIQAINSDIADYARWMNMPPKFGNQTIRAVGHKFEKAEDIPKKWMEIIKEVDPELYKNPFSALDRSESKYLG